jgi:hypothetical protein
MQSLGFLETAHSLNHIESEIIRSLGRMYLDTGKEEEEDALEVINKNLRIDISQILDGTYYVLFPLYSVRLGKADDCRRKSDPQKNSLTLRGVRMFEAIEIARIGTISGCVFASNPACPAKIPSGRLHALIKNATCFWASPYCLTGGIISLSMKSLNLGSNHCPSLSSTQSLLTVPCAKSFLIHCSHPIHSLSLMIFRSRM